MTAIVSILNRHAVAIAADSAVTMGGANKVVNCANKIFTVSKYHPVGVAVSGMASFMYVPWDIIIKEYRKQLKEKSFPKLHDYVEDFVNYLHEHKFFSDDTGQHYQIYNQIGFLLDQCRETMARHKGNDEKFMKEKMEDFLRWYISIHEKDNRCPEFKSYSYEEFAKYASEDISSFAKDVDFHNVDILTQYLYLRLCMASELPGQSVLAFVGYGEDEIYPSLYSISISCAVDNHLRYYYDHEDIILKNGLNAEIIPFGQSDVVDTIIGGILPNFDYLMENEIKRGINKCKDVILKRLDSKPDDDPAYSRLSSIIKRFSLSALTTDIIARIKREMYNKYSKPLLDTTSMLDKEDLANMAESLVSLTSLVRRMQPGEETVGGPVDVAVISKGDGFVWIKRKNYFKPELNPSFFHNYFR